MSGVRPEATTKGATRCIDSRSGDAGGGGVMSPLTREESTDPLFPRIHLRPGGLVSRLPPARSAQCPTHGEVLPVQFQAEGIQQQGALIGLARELEPPRPLVRLRPGEVRPHAPPP